MARKPLKRPHDVIAEVSHRTTGKPGKVIVNNRVVNPHKILKSQKRVSHFTLSKDFTLLKNFKFFALASEKVRGTRTQETVTPPFLPSFHTFEKKRGLPIIDLPKGGEGCLQVIVNFLKNGDEVAPGRHLLKIRKRWNNHF